MEDRLILGIPGEDDADAPKKRFSTSELAKRPRASTILPLFSTAWAAILLRLFSADATLASTPSSATHADNHPVVRDDVVEQPAGVESSEQRHLKENEGSTVKSIAGTYDPSPGQDFGALGFNRSNQPTPRLRHASHSSNLRPPSEALAANDNHHASRSAKHVGSAPRGVHDGSGGKGKNGSGPAEAGNSILASSNSQQAPASGTSRRNSNGSQVQASNPSAANRQPIITGPVLMSSGLVNQSIIITMGEFLEGATDPDGDALSVQALQVDSGELRFLGFNMWLYTPAPDEVGQVAFHYNVSDGTQNVAQSAFLELIAPAGRTIEGTSANDSLLGTPYDDVINAQAGDDIAYGREGADIIHGGEGADRLIGGDGNDTLIGSAGDDTLFGNAGNDMLLGDDGNDILFGDSGDDLLYGGDGNDTLDGGDGNDNLDSGAGSDLLNGGDGNDILDGGLGDDQLNGDSGHDILIGGAGSDNLSGGAGNDSLYGGDGNDTLDGGDGNDIVVGGAGDDAVSGGMGDDIIDAGDGNNRIDAGGGNDTIHLSSIQGNDVIHGGDGIDELDLSDVNLDCTVDFADGWANIADAVKAQIFEIENVHGGSGRDRLVADDHVNIFVGGAGNDTFVFRNLDALTNDGAPCDRVVDFSVGDRIDLSQLDGGSDGFAEQKLFFAGLASASPDEIGAVHFEHKFIDDEEVTLVTGHLDESGDKDFGLILDGHHDLTASDFILAARTLEGSA